MNNDVLQTLLVTYGAPLLFVAWVWWQSKGGVKDDPARRLLEELSDLNERVARIEGYLEGKK